MDREDTCAKARRSFICDARASRERRREGSIDPTRVVAIPKHTGTVTRRANRGAVFVSYADAVVPRVAPATCHYANRPTTIYVTGHERADDEEEEEEEERRAYCAHVRTSACDVSREKIE